MVFSTAYRLLANHAEVQDISQEVFLKAYDRYSEIGGNPRVGGWLKTVARNLCLNHLTRHRRRWRLGIDFLIGSWRILCFLRDLWQDLSRGKDILANPSPSWAWERL
ncbi:MAG: sigma-70 family RNA polymerase sigma factor [Opitutales bacterium]|nr:sigma-70 family RNA polymerase sigma factor [Opitutales bacterium]